MSNESLWAYRSPNLRALSYRFAVRSTEADVGLFVDALLMSLHDHDASTPVPSLYMLTASSNGATRTVDVRCNGVDVALGQRPRDAVGWLVWDVNRAAVAASGEHLLFHAGALNARGTGVLVPGASGAGKSTLVGGLAAAGLGYLTDELVGYDLASGQLLPYPKPIAMKPGGVGAHLETEHPSAADALDGSWDSGERYVPVGPGTTRPVGQACQPGLVVVPRYESEATTALIPLSDTEAFLSLAVNAVNLLSHGSAGTAVLGLLVARCTCVLLTMSDLDAACALVMNLVEELEPTRVEVSGHVG